MAESRTPHHNRIGECITYILTLLIGMQTLYAFAQWVGLLNSGNPRHAFTGSFYNSGPLACFLAVCLPLAAHAIRNKSNKYLRDTGIVVIVSCAVLIPFTLSRTALIAGGVGSLIAFNNYSRWRDLTISRLFIVTVAFCIMTAGLYTFKKDSADGRMLMWKVALLSIKENPITGVGWGNVAGTYGEAQERYFASGQGSEQDITVADAPEYVFNEYLQVAIAYGPLATVALLILIFGGLAMAICNHAYGFAGSAAAVAIVMVASYPLQFPLFVVTITLILIGAWISSSTTAIGWAATTVIIILTGLFLANGKRKDIDADFSVAHTLHTVGEYRKSTDKLLRLLPHTSDPMPLNILGKNYRALGMPDSAEHYLIRATHRCPNRLYPHYLLMQLYGDSLSYNPIRQRQEAAHILNTREKVSSRAVEEMREDASKILNMRE